MADEKDRQFFALNASHKGSLKSTHRSELKNLYSTIKDNDDTGKWIFSAGVNWPEFDFDKALNDLIKVDKTGEWILEAGREWKKFDQKKALGVLKKLGNKNKDLIFEAGCKWRRFDHAEGLKILKEIDKTGKYILKASENWEFFDFQRGLEILKKIKPRIFYKIALKKWPTTAKETLDKIEKETSRKKVAPDKKFTLESFTEELSCSTKKQL